MAKLIKNTKARPSNEFLIAAPCAVGKFDVVGEPGSWEVDIPDAQEFAITNALAFGGWTLKSPSIWVGSFILNFNGVTDFTFHAGEKRVDAPAPELSVAEMKKKLTEAGVKFHHFAKPETLAKLIEENGL